MGGQIGPKWLKTGHFWPDLAQKWQTVEKWKMAQNETKCFKINDITVRSHTSMTIEMTPKNTVCTPFILKDLRRVYYSYHAHIAHVKHSF